MSANGATPPPATVTVPQSTTVTGAEPPASREVAVATPSSALAQMADEGAPVNPFTGSGSFALAQRMANALASSTIVPKEYQGNVGNCLIAIEISGRIGMPVFMVMQNMVPIYGKPSWTSKFLIWIVNASTEWTSIRWRWVGERKDGDDWGVRAVATDRRTGEECIGPLVDIAMAKAEGWYDRKTKDGSGVASKWPTMPEVMLMYRSAAFWSRMFAPEKTLGLTTEELEDIGGTIRPDSIDVTPRSPALAPTPSKTLADVTARSREQRESRPTLGPAHVPVVSAASQSAGAAAAPDAERGQGTLAGVDTKPKPRRGITVTMPNGSTVNPEDEDAAARAATAPTEAEIAANGPPPVREPGADDDELPPWAK